MGAAAPKPADTPSTIPAVPPAAGLPSVPEGALPPAEMARRLADAERRARTNAVLAEELAARLKEVEERARKAEKLAYDVGTLAGGLVHEIKNPLSTLNINLQLLREDWQKDESQKGRSLVRKMDLLLRETKRLEGILNDFLKYARSQELSRADCNLNELLEDILRFIAPEAAAKSIQVRKSLDEKLPACLADANILRHALLNLVKNAQEAMPNGGDLMIRTSPGEGFLQIDITDTGVGIPPDRLDKIFRPFFSTKRSGTGLGLSTARRIIEQHGGSIAVHSEQGKGTNFVIRLPLADAASSKPKALPSAAKRPTALAHATS
ncbi:MAG: two-component sensor histidine kinase [Planctomycetes bacterium]|nr:two-component sensor histidine kinase [Planctomycetota bacterium]